MMAFGAIRAAADAGLSVPGDVSVVGFDDMQLADHMNPPLTTLRQDKGGLGSAAGRVLSRIVEGDSRGRRAHGRAPRRADRPRLQRPAREGVTTHTRPPERRFTQVTEKVFVTRREET